MFNNKIYHLNSIIIRLAIDAIISGTTLYLAYLARFDGRIPQLERRQFLLWLIPFVVGSLIAQRVYGVHKHKWRYVGTHDVIQISKAYLSLSLVVLALRLLLPSTDFYDLFRLPIGVIAVQFMASLLGAAGVRCVRRFIHQRRQTKKEDISLRILLVGAGHHGVTVANEMVLSGGVRIVGFVDDDPQKMGSVIAGLPVLGPVSSVAKIVEEYKVDEVLICVPPSGQKKLGIELPTELSKRTRIFPTLEEVLSGQPSSLRTPTVSVEPKTPSAIKTPLAIHAQQHCLPRGKTILITGGAGFIGSSLAEKLADNNQLILLDVTFHDKPVEFTSLLAHRNVQTVEGSLLNGLDLRGLCQDADIVVHAAALVGVNRVCNAGRETLETNYVGTSRLLQALEGTKKLHRLIYFSTSEVFGVNSFRVDEKSPPSVGPIAEARWSYAIAKLAGEHLVKAYFRETGMPITIVRPFNIFGPKRTGEHALLRFILCALTGKPLLVHGDGSQIRSWCYIEDFCSALLLMLARSESVGEDFNIGNPANTLTIYELARKVVSLCVTSSPIKFVDHPFPDISIRVPSLAKAQSLLDYRPRYDLDSAISLTIDWYRENLDFFGEAKALVAAPASSSFVSAVATAKV
jgi:nucleoside-diphosphate-sugar epimerase